MAKKIVFMGTPMFAVPILKSFIKMVIQYQMSIHNLLRNHKEVKKLINLLFKGLLKHLNLDFRTPKNLKDNNEELNILKA